MKTNVLQPSAILITEIRERLESPYTMHRLFEQADKAAYLRAGRIAGAGLNVFVDEPQVPTALFDLPNVVLQPHRASTTVQTRTRLGEMVLASLAEGLAGRRPANAVT